ncbi:response regulator [Pelagicoccus sp. SDUM812002]|uniref:response regulator n=1 Tax=Pelagicoccus sp. SDUM812002 TaxID=3041266 RepID=UPI00280E28F5|nr:response regulator [Pelagicoccus sp. SDUM812002]MDQ8186192.1 response regulator [Pelagicoccus sp. SDUM812002]
MADSKKIILLEDDKASARLLSAFLESKGYEVQESYEGRFAIELALREPPDLMIVDVLLPDMHGSEAVKKLTAIDRMHDLKVLFLTSLLSKSGDSGKVTRLKVAGKEYPALAKPFKPASLEEVISSILAGDN